MGGRAGGRKSVRIECLRHSSCSLKIALQRHASEIAEEIKPEMKFQSQAILAFCLHTITSLNDVIGVTLQTNPGRRSV